jgi:hypothetical protein
MRRPAGILLSQQPFPRRLLPSQRPHCSSSLQPLHQPAVLLEALFHLPWHLQQQQQQQQQQQLLRHHSQVAAPLASHLCV